MLGDIRSGQRTLNCLLLIAMHTGAQLSFLQVKHRHILKVDYSTYCPAMKTGIGVNTT